MTNQNHYIDLIRYHKTLLAEAEKYNQVEAAAYQRGMIEAYTRVLNTTKSK